MSLTVTPLTYCKKASCREVITVRDVYEEKTVTESPQHILVLYKCSACQSENQMIGTIQSWEEFKYEDEQERNSEDVLISSIIKAASIELDGIDSVDDLATLWRSFKRPPLREAVMGSCQCDECKNRRFL
jgi:hypothetical protein